VPVQQENENPCYKISKLQSKNDIPFKLLLLADETTEAIEKYIYNSDVYIVKQSEQAQPIAVFALYKSSNIEIEIKNIAVAELLRGKGIGSYLISEIKSIAKRENFSNIIVGTPDGAVRQINFNERNGFIRYDIRKDFFIENYSKPIFEDGVMLRDMVMLGSNV
jgi:ribosomal protein S18 acetylase RimI-like enzyme